MKTFNHLHKTITFLILSFTVFTVISCDNQEDYNEEPVFAEQTVFMYMPWSGEGIYPYFIDNISAFETTIKNNNGLSGKHFIVFISTNGTNAYMIDISYKNKEIARDTLKRYTFDTPEYTTASGISSILSDVMDAAPAKNYSMIIGCHGMGWLPVGTEVSRTKKRDTGSYKTRFFGHSSDNKYQTDITTLAEGIKSAGIKMDYILFDDCYMSNIETAYDLKDVTDYMIASTCEIMILGMPYDVIGSSLLKNDFQGVCDGFYSFYSSYTIPCGTIGVTDCREIDQMALIMKEINSSLSDDKSIDINGIQALDGLSPTVFFDFGDYVTDICEDNELSAAFNAQLDRLVPYKAHTDTYYSDYTKAQKPINTFSGLTISDPTANIRIKNLIKETGWYAATH